MLEILLEVVLPLAGFGVAIWVACWMADTVDTEKRQ